MPPATLAAAIAAEQQGQLDQAFALYADLLAHDPQCIEALNNLGSMAQRSGLTDDAINFFEQALQQQPDYLPAQVNLARSLSKQGNFEAARGVYAAALNTCPVSQHELAIALLSEQIQLHYRHGQLQRAQALAARAIGQFPANAELQLVAGNVALYLRDASAAARHYQQARSLDDSPRARANLALALFAQDQFEAAWPLYESRYASTLGANDKVSFAPQSCPQWQGQPLLGKRLLVLGEQGMGDHIHFVRFINQVAEQGAQVWLKCPPSLQALLATAPGLQGTFTTNESPTGFDYWSPLLSLPLHLGALNGRQFSAPYLRADEARRRHWREQLDSWRQTMPTVGLVWAGSAGNAVDYMRSLSQAQILDFVRPLASKALFFSLQKEGLSGPALSEQCQAGIIPLGDMLHDFADTAALLMELDFVITVDSAVAHLCGALGRPAHLLLSPALDWRWGKSGATQLELYPALTPHWRGPEQDWREVLAELANSLNTGLSQHKPV